MNMIKTKLTPELRKHIYQEFSEHAIASQGFDGLAEEPIAFQIQNGEIGCVVVQMFWGQLHIKYLLVEKVYRSQGFGRRLMEYAFQYGRNRGCQFAFVETMSFQGSDFYQKLGFKVELKRDGYASNVSFFYLKKDLL